MHNEIAAIHQFWLGDLSADGMCTSDRHALWFKADKRTDDTCRSRFTTLLDEALRGNLTHWAQTDSGLVALVILLDQFSRNIYRGTSRAFAGDPMALALAQQAISGGRHLRLPAIHKVFLYLPLEHSEELSTQQECVSLFEALADTTGDAQTESFARYAAAHRDVIAQFGRFPHRNNILQRQSSEAELAYLDKHGGF